MIAVKRRSRNKRLAGGKISQPPELDSSVNVHHVFRFVANAGALVGITVGNVLTSLGVMATLVAGTTKTTFASSFRVRKIEIWAPAAAAGAATPTVAWNGAGGRSRDEEKISTTVGTAAASYYASVPPKKSFAELWQDSTGSANVLFTLSAGVGAVIDLTVDFTLSNNDPGVTVTTGVASTAGLVTYFPLDGTGGQFRPQGLPLGG